eukprot:5107372-Pyramimonas_sp.AAC.2
MSVLVARVPPNPSAYRGLSTSTTSLSGRNRGAERSRMAAGGKLTTHPPLKGRAHFFLEGV